MEKETEGSIPFLNVHVKKDKSKQAIQETHPHGPLPPLQLKPPPKVKSGVADCHHHRANGDLP